MHFDCIGDDDGGEQGTVEVILMHDFGETEDLFRLVSQSNEGSDMTALRDSSVSTACMEHQVFEHIKQAVLVTLNWQAPAVSMPRKLSSLQFTMQSFQRHFERVVSIEEDGGYMAEATDLKPYFQERVDQLAQEHELFRERLRVLVRELNSISEWEAPRFEKIGCELREMMADLDQHNQREVELLQESVLMAEGGEV